MYGMLVVLQRELKQYFLTPFAYLIAFALLLLAGILFRNDIEASIGVKPPDAALIPSFLSFVLIFFGPLLTMRLLAEETREGTLELLLTAPVRDGEIVVGKFMGAWLYFTFLLVITFSYQLILLSLPRYVPDIGHAISAYLGIWLYGGATLAVGLLFSALTENQIIAAFLSMTTLLILWLADLIGQVVESIDLALIIRQLTLPGHFSTSFAVGIVRGEDIVYFAGIITIMLFITIRIVESRRWR
jgi:ABC-2 type transport system permease protein